LSETHAQTRTSKFLNRNSSLRRFSVARSERKNNLVRVSFFLKYRNRLNGSRIPIVFPPLTAYSKQQMIFALSIALAYALTNIDGLFAFFAIATSGRYRQALIGFLSAQVLVVTGAYVAGAGVTVLTPHALGYLGLVPLCLGIWEVWKNMSRDGLGADTSKPAHSVFSAAVIFIALSADTFILMAAFFADTAAVLDRHVLLGALVAVAGLVTAGTLLARSLGQNRKVQRFFEKLSPFVMIAAGIYILLDTATDSY